MPKKQTYRELSDELDEIISGLQTDDLDVDDAIKRYERGMEIVKDLEAQLKDAENKIKIVKKPVR